MEKRFLMVFPFILLLIFCGYAYGGQWKTYTVADGLVGPDITAIYQDSLGNLWFGTRNGGVSLFDGENFRSFGRQSGLVNGRIAQILEDKRGRLWLMIMRRPDNQRPPNFQEEGLVFRYDGKTFHRITEHDGLSGGIADAILRDKNGNIWIANKYGLMKYDGKRFHRFGGNEFQKFITSQSGTDGRLYAIFESRNGDIWLGGGPRMGPRDPRATDQRVFPFAILYNGNEFHFFSMDFLDPPPSASIRAIAEDNLGNIWLGGQSILIKYDSKSFERKEQSKFQSPNANISPGEIIVTWKESLGSTGEPIFPVITDIRSRPFRRSGEEWVTKAKGFQYRHKIAGISIDSILKDDRGRLWFNNRGFISLWDGKELRHFVIPANWEEIKGQIDQNKDELPSFYPGQVVSKDAHGNLWFGGVNGAYKFDGKSFRSFTVDDGLGSDTVSVIFEAMDGKLWFGHNNGVTLFDPAPLVIQNFTTREFFGSNSVHYIHEDKRGKIWFSVRGGVARYDGENMQYFTARDMDDQQLTPPPFPVDRNFAMNIVDGKNGDLWFVGFGTNQIFQYKDGKFQRYNVGTIRARPISWFMRGREGGRILAVDADGRLLFADGESLLRCGEDGLQLLTEKGFKPALSDARPGPPVGPGDFRRRITEIFVDSRGNIWFAINGVGLKRYDGVSLKTFSASDGLDENNIRKIFEDKQKNIWLVGEGVLIRYDGRLFQKFTVQNVTDIPVDIHQGSYGNISFIYPHAIARYDNEKLELLYQDGTLTASLGDNMVRASITDSSGNLWLATSDGVVKYDGKQFTTYTTENGLLINDIWDVQEDRWGNLWFATWGGGIALYNGENFQAITTKDGLIHNNVRAIFEDDHGNLWFATDGGITKYTLRSNVLPRVKLKRIIAKEAYTDFRKELQLPARIRNLTFEYQGFSLLQGNTVYTHKLEGFDANWSQPSAVKLIEYKGLKPGSYTFMVKALYKDSSYSNPPAVARFTIAPQFWTQPKVYLSIAGSIIIVSAFIFLIIRLMAQRRHSAALHAELRQKEESETQRVKKELNEARRMQMGLLPKSAPHISQFELSGISIPANEVGGDFYDYLTLDNDLIGIALVDVSGKGLQGAMNAVMAYGMLHEVAQLESKADMILSRLNTGLHPLLQDSMFAALNLGILNPKTRKIHYSNAGQTYPIIKRNGSAEGVELGGLPLGILADAAYDEEVIELHAGDYLIFYTDGLTDAMNEVEEIYGFDRLNDVIRNASASLSADGMIQHILRNIQDFVGESSQYDDMTLIVLRCMGH